MVDRQGGVIGRMGGWEMGLDRMKLVIGIGGASCQIRSIFSPC